MTTACLHGSKAWMNSVHKSGVKISIYLVFRNIIANFTLNPENNGYILVVYSKHLVVHLQHESVVSGFSVKLVIAW